jgi:hypothetical protein
MKNVATGIVTIMLIVTFIFVGMTITTRQEKEAEVSESLKEAVKSSVENVMSQGQYDINSNDQFLADFCEVLLSNVETGSEDEKDENLTIQVDVAGIDYDKGLLSIKVTETYTYPMSGIGTTTCLYTVVYDEQQEKEQVVITYQLEDGTIFKTYTTRVDETFMYPSTDPEQDGKTFKYWKNVSKSSDKITRSNHPDKASETVTYQAVFQ